MDSDVKNEIGKKSIELTRIQAKELAESYNAKEEDLEKRLRRIQPNQHTFKLSGEWDITFKDN